MGLDRGHLGDDILDLLDQHAFGQFQLQQKGVGAGFLQCANHLGDKVGLRKLGRADIDRQRPIFALRHLSPGHQLLASSLHDPFSERQDQPHVFGDRDEFSGQHQPTPWVLPAHQRFRTGHLAMAVDLHLVMQDELLSQHCLDQIIFKLDQRIEGRQHGRIVKKRPVAAGILGLVHRQVGFLEQVVNRVISVHEQHDTNARRAAEAMLLQPIGFAQRQHNLAGDTVGMGCGVLDMRTDRLDQDHEFVASQTGHAVVDANTSAQALRNLLQQHVTHGMAQAVIEAFEMIEVEEHQRAMGFGAFGRRHRLLQPVKQQATIGQIGQRVIESQPVNILELLTFQRDVTHQAEEGDAAIDGQPRYRQAHRKTAAIAAQAGDLARAAGLADPAWNELFPMPLRISHQQRDIAPQHIVLRVAEDGAGGMVERFDQPLRIDGDEAIDQIVENRLLVLGGFAQGLAAGTQFHL